MQTLSKFLTLAATVAATIPALADGRDSIRQYAIDSVVVTSYRAGMLLKDAPNQIEVISRGDIVRSPVVSVADLIKKYALAESADMQGLTGGLEFRGFTPLSTGTSTYSVMLLDGVPMGTRNAAATMTASVASAEILKGPFSALYGSGAMGGVVNLVSNRSRGKLSGSASLGYGSWNSLAAQASVGGNIVPRLDFDLALEHTNQLDDYTTGQHSVLKMTAYEKAVIDPLSYGARYNHTALEKTHGSLRLGYDLGGKWRINALGDLFYAGRAQGGGMLWGMYEQTDKCLTRSYGRVDVLGTAGRHTLRVTPYLSGERSDYRSDFGYDYVTRTRYRYNTAGFTAHDAIRLGRQTLVAGVDNFTQSYRSLQWKSDNSPDTPSQPDYRNIQTGVFVQANLSALGGRLTAVAGARYDNTAFRTLATDHLAGTPMRKSYHSFNPSVAARYKVFPALSLHASAGTAFLAPDAFKTTGEYTNSWGVYKGNPGLKPERSTSWDAGITFASAGGAVTADLTWFDTRHRGMIVFDYSNPGYTSYANSDRAALRGFEALASLDFGRMASKTWSLALTARWSRIVDSEVVTPTLRGERKYLSRNKASLCLEYADRRFSARILARYTGSRIEDNWIQGWNPVYDGDFNYLYSEMVPYVDKQGRTIRGSLYDQPEIRTPDFLVVDFYASYRFAGNFSVGIKASNLLDENYFERDGYYMPGRNLAGFLAWKF